MAGAGLLRWLRHSPTGQAIGARLGAAYIRLVRATTRWQVEGKEPFDRLARDSAPFIAVVWHGRLFLSPALRPPGREGVAMISNNRDGDLIAAVCERFGIRSVRGSTHDKAKGRDKGGASAFRGALAALRAGAVLAITPDGPRGPRMRAQAGSAQLAAQAGVPVIPVGFSTARARIAKSWDRFLIPAPFGRGAVVYGPPLSAEGTDAAAVERLRAGIERALREVTDRADALCARPPVPPEALPHPVACAAPDRAAGSRAQAPLSPPSGALPSRVPGHQPEDHSEPKPQKPRWAG